MLILGHAGITCGAATLLAGTVTAVRGQGSRSGSWFARATRFIDLRLVLIGSLLPDIIDKPVGLYLLRDSISYGRIYAHTLLFFVLLGVTGGIIYRRLGSAAGLALAFGTLFHLLLDEMWRETAVLFWPVYGTAFPTYEAAEWFTDMLYALLHDPYLAATEAAGGAILLWMGIMLIRNRGLTRFLKYGRIAEGKVKV